MFILGASFTYTGQILCKSQQLAVGHALPELPSSFLPSLSNCLLFKSCRCPYPAPKHLKFISQQVLSSWGKEKQVDTFKTWKGVCLPPECFQSQPPNTESSCAQVPRQVQGSLEVTQWPLFQAEGEEKGANTGEPGEGSTGGGALISGRKSPAG